MGLRWVPTSLLLVPYLCFEIGENSYLNSVKAGKTRQIEFGSGGVPAGIDFVAMPTRLYGVCF